MGRTTWFYMVDGGRNALGKRVQKLMGGFRTRREAESAMRDFTRDLDNRN